MKLRLQSAVFMILLFTALMSATAVSSQLNEIPQLNSFADDLATLGFIPGGVLRILLSAHNGWPGMYPTILEISGDSIDIDTIASLMSAEYSYCGISSGDFPGGTGILVLASAPICVPVALSSQVISGAFTSFSLDGYENLCDPETALLTPGMKIIELYPDSVGNLSFTFTETGIYWLEVIHNTHAGPSIALLFPVICGGNINDVLSGVIPLTGTDADVSSKEDIFTELNALRTSYGLLPLRINPYLDSIANIRAENLALTGSTEHFNNGGNGIIELLSDSISVFAENIARGSGYQESWEMLQISPFHLKACLTPHFTEFGSGAAIDSQPYEWQLVYVQVFTGIRSVP